MEMRGAGRFLILMVVVLTTALLTQACGRQIDGDERSESALGVRPGEVGAVVVSWEPTLKRVPPPRRTTDRKQFASLLDALGRVTEQASPPDLLGPPVHITLELTSGKARRFELWGPYLADKETNLLYGIPDDLLKTLRAALEPLSPPPISAPDRLSGMITVADLVRALQEHGAEDARETGEEIRVLLFGARSGQVVELLGQKVQVYTMESPEAAARAAALDPMQMTVDWIAEPYFVAVGNLVVTVVVPEPEFARKIVAYLEMVRTE